MAFIISKIDRLLIDAFVAKDKILPNWWNNISLRNNLLKIAFENELESQLAHCLADILGWDALPDTMVEMHKKNHHIISAYMKELDRVADLLYNSNIPIVALKNVGIARGIYPCPGCAPMGDIDVLVEKRFFRQAHKILLTEGYHFEFRSPLEVANLETAEENGGAEYWKILPSGEKLWLELQWRPIAGRWIRPDQEPSAEVLLRRSIPIEGTTVLLLAPEDNLLQVSLHTAKHSYVRAPGFRLHTDVDRIVNYQEIDWDLFLKRVLNLQVKTAVYFSLLIPKELFKTPVPDYVLEKLEPNGWKKSLIIKWIQKAGLFNPDEKKFSKIGYIIFTSLLYDDLKGFFRGILPDKEWMKKNHKVYSTSKLPLLYLKRLVNLAFSRVNT
jgi:hypothetical protein